tara:strand:+ start:415 stop:846 length:432 start_codon:yes stop_codon:yes gene_type:complete
LLPVSILRVVFFEEDGVSLGYLDLRAFVDEEIWIDDLGYSADRYVDLATVEKFELVPPSGGSSISVFTFMPDDGVSYGSEVISKAAERFNTGDSIDPHNLGMHITQMIDYGFVLFGAITLELDEGTRELSAQDVIVQRATAHA